nr:hypothetical protein [Tanacetum cinerariifolium]
MMFPLSLTGEAKIWQYYQNLLSWSQRENLRSSKCRSWWVVDKLYSCYLVGLVKCCLEEIQKVDQIASQIVPLFDTMLVQQGEGSGTPTEPHHTPSPEVTSSHPSTSSIPLPSIPTAPIPPVTQTGTTPIIQYIRRARIAQSSALPTVADEPTSPDRATIAKSFTLPRDSAPRVTSPAAEEGSMEQIINELTAFCTSQTQHSELLAKFQAQEWLKELGRACAIAGSFGGKWCSKATVCLESGKEDAAYHKEKMLLCKQEEAEFKFNAEQAKWKDDTDDEPEDQELEAHYMYMAKLQKVTLDAVDNSGPIFDTEPLQKLADLFTKALSEDRFKYLVKRLGMRCLTPEELEVLANESA